MYTIARFLIITLLLMQFYAADAQKKSTSTLSFPDELVHFKAYKSNPVFAGTDSNTWDTHIRERGYILHEGSIYKMWYTGYQKETDEKHLGYATSPDGLVWTRHPNNPIHNNHWVEDMYVIKDGNSYYMFAEGKDDIAHMLTSANGIDWTEQGNLDIRLTNGDPIPAGAFGTPCVWRENGKWYLFYERDDLGIWLAVSTDLKVWKNVQDEPVLAMGPDAYDKYAVAMNQVIKYKGLYYGYYHASDTKEWKEWSTNVAVSNDLIHWKKYEKNPIVRNNCSSGILVQDGKAYRLYTMHPQVNVFFPVSSKK
ncbi:MAG: glycosylase [Agriterribacter sp.]